MSGAEASGAGPVTVTLTTPVRGIDTMVSAITIQPPTGKHLMKAGPVMRMIASDDGGETAIEINPAAMGKLISTCGNLPFLTVETLSMKDFMALSNAVMGFLGGAAS